MFKKKIRNTNVRQTRKGRSDRQQQRFFDERSWKTKPRFATDKLVGQAFNLRRGDINKVEWLQWGLRYTCPFDYEARTPLVPLYTADSCLQARTHEAVEAYIPDIFAEALRDALFANANSHGHFMVDRFTSSSSEAPEEKEVPATMLAVISTAVSYTCVMISWLTCIVSRSTHRSTASAMTRLVESQATSTPRLTSRTWTRSRRSSARGRVATTASCMTSTRKPGECPVCT